MFKVGDRIRFKDLNASPGGFGGARSLGYPPPGTEGEIVSAGPWQTYEVAHSDSSVKSPLFVFDCDIEYIPANLPIGQANQLLTADLFNEWGCDIVPEPAPKKCDCGGYKVYKSYDRSYHSHWCSSQK